MCGYGGYSGYSGCGGHGGIPSQSEVDACCHITPCLYSQQDVYQTFASARKETLWQLKQDHKKKDAVSGSSGYSMEKKRKKQDHTIKALNDRANADSNGKSLFNFNYDDVGEDTKPVSKPSPSYKNAALVCQGLKKKSKCGSE